MRFDRGTKFDPTNMNRLRSSIPVSYTIYYDGDGYYRAESSSPSLQDRAVKSTKPNAAGTLIQQAIGDDRLLYFRNGTYLLGDSLTITPAYRNNLVFEGESKMGTILKLNDNVNKDVITQTAGTCYNVHFRNLTINGNRTNNTDGTGISLTAVESSAIDVYVGNCEKNGINKLGFLWNCLVSNCGSRGVVMGTDAAMINCYVNHCGDRGAAPYWDSNASNVWLGGYTTRIINNHIWGAESGSQGGIMMHYAVDSIIANNIIEENYGNGIFLYGRALYNQILGNSIDNNNLGGGNYDGIKFSIGGAETGYQNIIANNTFFKEAAGDAPHKYCVRESTNCDYNIIRDNMMKGGYTTAPVLIVGNNTVVRGNLGYTTENSDASTGTGATQTIPHGLDVTPTRLLLGSLDQGANPYWTSAPDATNIYVSAGAGLSYTWRAWIE